MLMRMKVVVLYRPSSGHARTVETFVADLSRQSPNSRVDLLNVDTRDGAATASLYDIMQFPAILALQNDGQLLKDWQGGSMPLLSEVSYYASGDGGGIMSARSTLSVFG